MPFYQTVEQIRTLSRHNPSNIIENVSNIISKLETLGKDLDAVTFTDQKFSISLAVKNLLDKIYIASRLHSHPARKKASDGGSIGMAMVIQAQRDYKGTHIKGDLGGVKVGNKSYQKYYKGMI